MAHIKPIQISSADSATQATLEAVKKQLGMVPNLFATFAHSPAVLNGYLAFSGALGQSKLTAGEREVVALATAQANQCAYCLAAHTMIGKGAGLDENTIASARQGGGNARNGALAQLAQRITTTRAQLSAEEVSAFKAKGFDDAEVLEVIALVALNTLTNYVNHIAGTDVDFPAVSL